MAKELIKIDGVEKIVREDTAKAYRGVYWALISLAAIVLIASILFFGGFLKLASDGDIDKASPPAERSIGS